MGVCAVAVLVAVVGRLFIAETFVIPSTSMQPGLEPGDRVLVSKVGAPQPQRGDIVVFNGVSTFGPLPASGGLAGTVEDLADLLAGRPGAADYVKRVIGVGGDRVACCSAAGNLTVNGVALNEPYLYPGDRASEMTFDVEVPPGRVWLMGDHRSDSADSRFHLGDPGGGTVAVADVVGPVSFRFWPANRIGGLSAAAPAPTGAVTSAHGGQP